MKMQAPSIYVKSSYFETLMCKAYDIPYGQGKRTDVTHAYQTLLYAIKEGKPGDSKLRKQFDFVVKLLQSAVEKFRERNTDIEKTDKLKEIAATLATTSYEEEIDWSVEELMKLGPF